MKFWKKNEKIRNFLLLAFFVLYFFSTALFVNALEIEYPEIFGVSVGDGSLAEYARYFFNVGVFLSTILAVIVIVFGGIYYLVDFASGKFTSEGKEWIKAGIAGLLLTTCAYLIAFTINPYLVIFDLKGLAPLTYLSNLLNPPKPSSLQIDVYNEIPIGTLTESLLSRTIDCYNFDSNGDPIDGEIITTDENKKIIGPTYLEHDRADCILKLGQAAENKTDIIKELSDEIVDLMNSCNCSQPASSGGSDSGGDTTTCQTTDPSKPGYCPGGGKCVSGKCTYSSSSSSKSNSTGDVYYALTDSTSSSGDGFCINKTCSTKADEKTGETEDCKKTKCDKSTLSDVGTTKNCSDSCQNKGCVCNGKSCDRCPEGYKDKIDHGPICLTYLCGETRGLSPISSTSNNSNTKCDVTEKDFAGLDEFKSQFSNSYDLIKQQVEMQPAPKVNGKEVSIIKGGNCELCTTQCSVCNPDSDDYSNCLTKREDCQKEVSSCQNKRKQCLIKNSAWYKLRLVDQLTYLKGKIEEIKESVKTDLNNLQKAEAELGKCYLASSYVDFLKTYEETNKKETTVLINQTYSDQDTKSLVNPAKYCKGYQYNNSTCYSQCKKICPGNQQKDFNCFKNIDTCGNDLTASEKKICLAKQTIEYSDCLNNQSCTAGASSFSTFGQCFNTCQQKCLDNCDTLCATSEKSACKQKCNTNSKCVIENAGACLVDFEKLKNCATENNNLESLQKCAEAAKRCQYCSDQYAGYADCLKSPYSLQNNFSSSYIYQHPNYQICKSPNEYSTQLDSTCITLYPETTKCPASSQCPECPCDTVSELVSNNSLSNTTTSSAASLASGICQTTNPSKPGYCPGGGKCVNGTCTYGSITTCQTTDPSKPGYCPGGGKCVNGTCTYSSNATCQTTDPSKPGYCPGGGKCVNGTCTYSSGNSNVKEYKSCSGDCDEFSFNDDPLTFYCNSTWWTKEAAKKTTPVGEEKICLKSREVPVGQTVDDSEVWGQYFLDSIDSLTKKIQSTIDYVKKIGDEKNYCQCDSKCDDAGNEPTCKDLCIFQESETPSDDGTYSCSCKRQGCSGNPCQKIINLLEGKKSNTDCPKGIEYKGIEYYQTEITSAIKTFYDFTVLQSRSDIVKELNYSRNKTNECSTTQNNYNTKEVNLLSCTRTEDEIISPIVDSNNKAIVASGAVSSYCYGKELGKVSGNSEALMDNWFCCELRDKKSQ